MCKGPVGQYANYIDEGTERANDSQSVKCFSCLPARADLLTPFDDPQAKGHPSGGQRASAGRRGVAMVTALAEEMARCGVQEERGHCGCTERWCHATCLRCVQRQLGKCFWGGVCHIRPVSSTTATSNLLQTNANQCSAFIKSASLVWLFIWCQHLKKFRHFYTYTHTHTQWTHSTHTPYWYENIHQSNVWISQFDTRFLMVI